VYVHGPYLYWLTGGQTAATAGSLVRQVKTGGMTEVLSPAYVGTGYVVVDDQYAYWSVVGDLSSGQGQVFRLATNGTGQVETMLSGVDTPWRLELDANTLYVGIGALTQVQNNIFNGRIVALDKVAPAPVPVTSVVDNQSGLRGVAVDSTYVYWIANVPHDGIFKAPKAGGGAPIVVATGQALPVDIAVDDHYIFWINSSVPNGAVMRLSK
jgi:hypothetical protein